MAELPLVHRLRLLGLSAALLLAVLSQAPAAGRQPEAISSVALPASQPPAGGSSAAKEQVVEVRIVGNRTIPREKILPHVYTRAGRPFDVRLIEEDVRRLNRSGMFVYVRPLTQRVPGGRVVIFEVAERPILLEVKYVGNRRVSRKVLQQQTGLKVGDALDPFEVEEGRRKIEEYYHSKGYSKVRVTILEGNKPTDRRAIYLINEGPRQKIVWTSFVGNTIASDARLRTQIKSKPPILYLFKGDLNREQLDEDVRRLTAYYRGLGFFRARIGREVEDSGWDNWVWVTFVIDEGPRYKVRDVSFVGNKKFSTEQLAQKVSLRGGEYFNQAQLNADLAAIREQYGSVGYIFADVKAEPRFLDEPGLLDLVYNISEGDRYRVGRINVEIKGDVPHTRISTVLNRISLKPGDIVDIRELRASERRLRASGLFLVDPAAGIVPKIVFSPLELEDDTHVARDPRHRVNYRGQSPDEPRHSSSGGGYRRVYSTPRAQLPPAVPVVDLTLRGEIDPSSAPGQTAGLSQPVANGPAVSCVWRAGGSLPQQRIVRGQDAYDPNAGRSLPPLRRSPSFPAASSPQARGSLPAAPNYGSSVAGNGAVRNFPGRPPEPSSEALEPVARPANTSPARLAPQTGAGATSAAGNTTGGSTGAAPGWTNSAPATSGEGMTSGWSPGSSPTASVPPPNSLAAPGNSAAPSAISPVSPPAGPQPQTAPGQLPPNEPVFGTESPFDRAFEEPTREIDIIPQVYETHTGRLMLGVGINSDAGLVGSFVLEEQNFDWTRFPRSWQDIRMGTAFRGAGQRFRLEAVPGTEVQRYLVSFQDPYLMRTNVSLGLSGFYYDRLYFEWNENRLGGRVSLGYHFTPSLSGTFAFRGERVNIYDPIAPPGVVPELDEVLGDNSLFGFSVSLAHDTRDSAFLRHVISLSGRLGISGSETPIYDHYYAGGFSTLRGYDFRGASPLSGGVRVGGEFLLLASAEYMFPITADDTLRAVVFCDTGTVEPTINQWNQRYRVSPGFGLRILIPAMGPAPIALDFAFPVSSDPQDDEEVFSFFLGVLR